MINNFTLFILALANASVVVGMGLLTPSILLIKSHFSANAEVVQLLLSYYMVAAGLGQLIFGTLSDIYGRKPILILGGFLFSAASLFSIFASDLIYLLILRTFQGLGAAACMSMARVIITDSFKKAEAAEKLSLMTAIMVIFPLISLILGGFIAEAIGWIGVMYIFVIFGLIIFVFAFFKISESKVDRVENLGINNIYLSYVTVLKNSKFLNLMLISSIQVGVFFSSFGFMPYEFGRLGISPLEFGFWLSFTGVGYFFGNILNRYYASILGLEKLIIIGSALSVLSYLSMLFMHLNGFLSPLYIAVPVMLFGLGNGFTVANCIIGAVSTTGNNSGTATGVAGALQMSSGGIIGMLVIFMGGANSFLVCLLIINLLCITAFVSSVINYRGSAMVKG